MSDLNNLPDLDDSQATVLSPAAGEKGAAPAGVAPVDPEATVLAPAPAAPAAEVDPEATVLAAAADPEATVLAVPDPADDPVVAPDPEATVLSDAAPTTVVPEPPTTFNPIPAPMTDVMPGHDGLDAMDDLYYSPAVMQDLTTAHAPVSIDSPVKSTSQKKRRRNIVWTVIIAILLLGLAGAAGYYTYQQEFWGGKTVPSVLGKTEVEARQMLEASGFKVTSQQQASDQTAGTVLACDPEPGRRADPAGGATITVAAARTVPQVVGKTQDEAKKLLSEAGASNVVLSFVISDQAEGTVVSVDPKEGATFVATDKITLSVAQPYTVPAVVGLSLSEAQAALTSAGLTSNVTYVESEKSGNTVISATPEPGTKASAGMAVELKVSSPYPSSTTKLADYFDCTPQEVAAYLQKEGFSLLYGSKYGNGDAHAVYANSAGDMLTVSDEPESGAYSNDATTDVLAEGAVIGGIRFDFATATAPSTAETTDGLKAVMAACGFDGLKETTTQADMASTMNIDMGVSHFICGYGEQDGYSWAVLIGGNTAGRSAVTVLMCPKSRFNGGIDLAEFGNKASLCVAFYNIVMR